MELTPTEVYRDCRITQAKIGYHWTHTGRIPGDFSDQRWGYANSFEQARGHIDGCLERLAPARTLFDL